MINRLNDLFYSSERSMRLQSGRLELLADNMANAQTPGYKARDLDFRALMANQLSGVAELNMTHSRHLGRQDTANGAPEAYRIPTRSVADGNTVEEEVEQAAFSDAALRYQVSLQFINSSISKLRLAIKGE